MELANKNVAHIFISRISLVTFTHDNCIVNAVDSQPEIDVLDEGHAIDYAMYLYLSVLCGH